jgi:hypothetical protein
VSGIIVAGMHRSGTSLATRFLVAGGWDPGEVLLSSPKEEYYEDSSFVDLHRRWLAELIGTNVDGLEQDLRHFSCSEYRSDSTS